jgi:hypothetical protein
MRRNVLLFLAAVTAPVLVAAQGGHDPEIVVTGLRMPVRRAMVSVALPDDTLKELGQTDAKGTLAYNPSVLTGKPDVDAEVIRCPNQSTQVFVNIFPSGVLGGPPPDGCTKDRVSGIGAWGSGLTVALPFAVDATATPDTGRSFFTTPAGLGTIAGAVVIGTVVAMHGGSSSSPGSSTTPTTEVRSEATVVNNVFTAVYGLTAGSSCGFPASATGSMTFSGNQTATSVLITGLPIGAITAKGSVSQGSNGAFSFTGTGSSSTPTGGTAAVTVTVNFTVGANTATLTGTGASACGQWTIAASLTR